jgi:hypothetical protein
MSTIIDALDFVRNKKGLPVEAFFVDTNIVIDYKDPFGRTTGNKMLAQRNEELTEAVNRFKELGYKVYSTTSVAIEYYKHIQVGFYCLFTETQKLDLRDFKNRRDNDVNFITRWDSQIKAFKKVYNILLQH